MPGRDGLPRVIHCVKNKFSKAEQGKQPWTEKQFADAVFNALTNEVADKTARAHSQHEGNTMAPWLEVVFGKSSLHISPTSTGKEHLAKNMEKFATWIMEYLVPLAEKVFLAGPQPTPMPEPKIAFSFLQSQNVDTKDKVSWNPNKRKWDIAVKKSKVGDVETYLAKNDINFNAKFGKTVSREEFIASREDAHIRACMYWDALDGSKRQRIGLTATPQCDDTTITAQADQVVVNDSGEETDTEPQNGPLGLGALLDDLEGSEDDDEEERPPPTLDEAHSQLLSQNLKSPSVFYSRKM